MSSINKIPPSLLGTKSYDDWLKLVHTWKKLNSLQPEKQGPATVLSLDSVDKEAVLELVGDTTAL